MTSTTYTTMDICKQLNIPRHMITNLCRRGLIPHVRRTGLGYRTFDQEQFDLIVILVKMRLAGFTPTELRQYSRLYREGESTAEKRLAMLTTHKHQLQQKIREHQDSISFIERQEELAKQK